MGFKRHAGWLRFTSLTKGRKKIRDQGNVNAPSPHLSHNETPLWLPFSSTRGVFGEREKQKSTFAFTICMKSWPGFGDKGSGLEKTQQHNK